MKLKIIITIIFFTLYSAKLFSQGIYSASGGNASFYSSAPLEDIEAVSTGMSSVLNAATGEIVFIVPIRSFRFKKSLMEEHFNEKYLESDKYPQAIYKGKINEMPDISKDGQYRISSSGSLNIHNVNIQRTDSAMLTVKEGVISMEGNFKVALKDHDIEIPKLVIRNIAEVVDVKFSARYAPYKKE